MLIPSKSATEMLLGIRAKGISRHAGISSIFLAINRNKRSVTLDLKKAKGLELFLELAAGLDVVVHKMRIAALDPSGLVMRQFEPSNNVWCTVPQAGLAKMGRTAPSPALTTSS